MPTHRRWQPISPAERLARIPKAGVEKIAFAWAGDAARGQRHYYRVQGPTFLIEYDNTQNDANHIHSVWRDFEGDFGRDLLREHLKTSRTEQDERSHEELEEVSSQFPDFLPSWCTEHQISAARSRPPVSSSSPDRRDRASGSSRTRSPARSRRGCGRADRGGRDDRASSRRPRSRRSDSRCPLPAISGAEP